MFHNPGGDCYWVGRPLDQRYMFSCVVLKASGEDSTTKKHLVKV